ncbi:MAG: outer membrane protein assembly factor BamE domain-containing protein [Rickettsiales bacterium]
MKSFFQQIYLILAIQLLLILGSCSSKIDNQGYIFDDLDFSKIQKNVTSKNTILQIYGSPSFYSDVSDKEYWFYYSNQVKKFLFFKPEILTQDVLIVSFDEDDRVDFVKILDIKDKDYSFYFNINRTEVKGHEKGFFKSIFENVGTIKSN